MSDFKLYEYTHNYEVLADILEENPDLDYIDALEGIKESAEEKISNTAGFIKKLEDDVKRIKDREKELKDMRFTKEKQVENIKAYLLDNMLRMDIKKVDTGTRVVRYQNNRPSLHITDVNKVPQDFKTNETVLNITEEDVPKSLKDALVSSDVKVNKADLMKFIKDLDEEEYKEYAELVQTKSLRIK